VRPQRRPPPQHTRGYAIVQNGNEERRSPRGAPLSPAQTVQVANGFCGLPRARAWPSLAHGQRAAPPWRRPGGGDGSLARPPRDPAIALGTRHCHGARASIRVGGSHSGGPLRIESQSAAATAWQLHSAREGGKNVKNRS